MNLFANIRLTIAVNILLILVSAFALNSFLNYKSYTLEENGNWLSSKTNLKGVNGVYANLFTKVALSKNRLNTGAWFGYQELIYHQPVDFNSIVFRYGFLIRPFSFILDKHDSLTYGIHFNDKDSTSFLFVADKEGRFLHRQNFSVSAAQKHLRWNEAEIKHHNDSVYVIINGQNCFSASFKLRNKVSFGFRGGPFDLYVDDVIVYDEHGTIVAADNFNPPFKWNKWTLVFVLLSLAFLLLLQRNSFRPSLTAFNLAVCIGIVTMYGAYFFFLSARYQSNADWIDWHGKTVTFDVPEVVCKKIKDKYPLSDKRPAVMFIGSSQTWGAGASKPEQAYPAIAEQNLRNYFHDSTLIVINAGACGLSSDYLYRLYTSDWHQHRPLLAVIDLAYNDRDTAVFREYMQKFLEFNGQKNIRTMLIAEPNDYMNERLAAKHRIVNEVAAQFHAPTIPMQPFIDRNSTSGFIWWDRVHMTDYGYRLFAAGVTPYLIKELELSAYY